MSTGRQRRASTAPFSKAELGSTSSSAISTQAVDGALWYFPGPDARYVSVDPLYVGPDARSVRPPSAHRDPYWSRLLSLLYRLHR